MPLELVDLINWLAPILIPSVLLIALEVIVAIILIRMIVRYPHVILSRWDLLMILIFIAGFFIFDVAVAWLGGAMPPGSLAALSRLNRIVMLASMIWVMHAAMRRQELMGTAENGGD